MRDDAVAWYKPNRAAFSARRRLDEHATMCFGAEIDLMLETNLTSCVKLTRDFLRFMLEVPASSYVPRFEVEANGGHIVNIASIAGQAAWFLL